MANKSYSSEDIQILKELEAVRVRPGMYIGSTGSKGLHHILWEIIDNAVDEAANGYANKVIVCLHDDGSASVEDNGRGMPVDIHPEAKVSVVGYTCDLDTKMINEELGFDRAIHVRNYLIRYGAFEEQVEMDSQSTHNPVAPNTSEKNREKNRRTEIKLIKKK